ncbi:MAG: hypothetical protein A2020_13175 [Lentisphaerae bacterium GWF2_45_14]|nr:MAG: hypothetical protein A2020_13175 [Lentisphaerae bacterium GWF2_45_14]
MIGWIYIFKIFYIALFWLCIISPVIFFVLLHFSKHKKRIILLLPLFSFALCNACIWSGFHYRMELRERFGRDERGNININRMPQDIRSKYDANDGHPRLRDCKGVLLWGWFALPFYCLTLSPFYLIILKTTRKSDNVPRGR